MKAVKLILRILSWILMACMVLFIGANLYTTIARKTTNKVQPTVFGFSTAVIITGSMLPVLEPNDYIIVQKQKEYYVNDIITYEGMSSSVTHRIIEVTEQGYLTQGDANNTDDGRPIPKDRVVGKVIYCIPQLGVAIRFLQSPLGMCIMALLLFALIELPIIMGKQGKKVSDANNQNPEDNTEDNSGGDTNQS